MAQNPTDRGRKVERVKEGLRNSSLFNELTDAELEEVAKLGREVTYEVGEYVFNEGEIARELHIVVEGKVALEMSVRLGQKATRQGSVAALGAGQVFGWSAVADSNTFTMSARCVERATIIALDRQGLARLFEENPELGYKAMKKIVGVVSSRLRCSRDALAHVLSIAFHDLKAPLAAVQSYLRVLIDGYAGEISDKQRTMIVRSSERIDGLLNLINNLLDISRIDTRQLEIQDVSLVAEMENSVVTTRRLANLKGVRLKIETHGVLPPIAADPNRLRQVFNNMLENALKFTPKGGSVTVRLADQHDNVLVEVIDTGVGIRADELPKIFENFYQGAEVDCEGIGLGLTIAKKIVEAHGGRIWAESPCPETGFGSKFSFTLPKGAACVAGADGKDAPL